LQIKQRLGLQTLALQVLVPPGQTEIAPMLPGQAPLQHGVPPTTQETPGLRHVPPPPPPPVDTQMPPEQVNPAQQEALF
jgi:hypothetical protein